MAVAGVCNALFGGNAPRSTKGFAERLIGIWFVAEWARKSCRIKNFGVCGISPLSGRKSYIVILSETRAHFIVHHQRPMTLRRMDFGP